jgi:hypothetical protein
MKGKVPLATLSLLLLLASCGPGPNSPNGAGTGAGRLQPGVGGALRERDTNQIEHFWFSYPFEPQPGNRVWINVRQTNWVEIYPDGSQSRYRLVGRETVDGFTGVVVSKTSGDLQVTETLNDGSFEAFLPDKTNAKVVLYFRNRIDGQWQPWRALAQVNSID